MNKAYRTLVTLFLLILLAGCNTDQSQIKKLQEENQQLQKQILELKAKIDNLSEDYLVLKAEYDQSIIQNQELAKELKEKSLKINESEKTVNPTSPNVFNPETIQKGDNIAGMIVTDIKRDLSNPEYTWFYISFDGEFTITGDLMIDVAESGAYQIQINDEQMTRLPHILNSQGSHMQFTNPDDFIIAAGKKLEKITDQNSLPVQVKLSNFTFKYSYKGMPHTAKFLKLVQLGD